jgi:hypothetical protein
MIDTMDEDDLRRQYLQLIGRLQWMTRTRIDLLEDASQFARRSTNPSRDDLKSLIEVLTHAASCHYGRPIRKTSKYNHTIRIVCDASTGTNKDSYGQSGYIISLVSH